MMVEAVQHAEVKAFIYEDNAFEDAVSRIARADGYSVIYPKHIFETLLSSKDPEIVSVLPGGFNTAEGIVERMQREHDETVEPWLGNVAVIGRSKVIFENAQEQAKRAGRETPTQLDYFIGLLKEEAKGATDVSAILFARGIRTDVLLYGLLHAGNE